MLTLYNGNTPVVLKYDDYHIRQLSNGLDELIFEVSVKDDDYKLIVEEAQIQDRGEQVYLVKQIDGGNDRAKVVCQIDVDPWRGAFFENYSNESATILQTLLQVRPEGWTVEDRSGISTRRTIPTSDTAQPYSVTAWQVVEAVCNMWDVRIRVDTAAKKLTVLNPKTYGSVGAFASRELNLRQLSYKGKSQGFVTRLYAEGADGLTFADINDGKNYVEDKTYKDVVVSAFWKDERYTDKNSLLEDARAKLSVMAKPQISYDCDIIDLAAIDPSRQWSQDMSMFARITLLDDTRGTAIEHQVVERWEYPYYPNKDKVVLSTQVPKIQTQVQTVINAIDNPTSVYNQIISATVQNQTNMITGNNGGYVVLHDSNGDGHPDELLIMDTPDINTAQELWRWNAAGLGYSRTGYNGTFITAWTMEGSFNADFITAGTIDAEIVRVINLIADKVISYTPDTTRRAEIVGGRMGYQGKTDSEDYVDLINLNANLVQGAAERFSGTVNLFQMETDGTYTSRALISSDSVFIGMNPLAIRLDPKDATGEAAAGNVYANHHIVLGAGKDTPDGTFAIGYFRDQFKNVELVTGLSFIDVNINGTTYKLLGKVAT
jgi:phage minor structural protein